MKTLEKFQGHIVLYCKGYYQQKNVGFIEGLQRIWAIRCGHDIGQIDDSCNEYIADDMYRIMQELIPEKLTYLWELIHKEVSKTYLSQYKGLSTIEKLITIYKNEIGMIQIKEITENGGRRTLVKLPKPQRRLFNSIVKGNGKFGDYELVK